MLGVPRTLLRVTQRCYQTSLWKQLSKSTRFDSNRFISTGGLKCNCDKPAKGAPPASCGVKPPAPTPSPAAILSAAAASETPDPNCTCGPPAVKCPEKKDTEKMPLIPLKEARRFMYDCLVGAGASPEHATLQADMMLFADRQGIFSEGMNHLEMYCTMIKNKRVSKEMPEIINETPSCGFVDSKNALGAVSGSFCMDLAIKKAKLCGIGFVACKNSSNFGCSAFYTDRAIKNGLIALAFSNGPAVVVPPGATEAVFGTNPIAFAAPISFCDSVCLDCATSVASLGKIEMFAKEKKCLPNGWAEHEGKPVKDPEWVLNHGGLLPLGGSVETGGHKGFGLSIMVDALTGVLSGSEFGPKITKDKDCPSPLSQSFLVINPEMFASGFTERMKWLATHIRTMTPAVEGKNVMMPGDHERKFADAIDIEGGITYLKAQMGQCCRLADEYKVKPLGEAKPNV